MLSRLERRPLKLVALAGVLIYAASMLVLLFVSVAGGILMIMARFMAARGFHIWRIAHHEGLPVWRISLFVIEGLLAVVIVIYAFLYAPGSVIAYLGP